MIRNASESFVFRSVILKQAGCYVTPWIVVLFLEIKPWIMDSEIGLFGGNYVRNSPIIALGGLRVSELVCECLYC